MIQDTVIRTYTGSQTSIYRQFEADLRWMQERGYEVVSQSAMTGHRGGCMGCLGVLTLGILFLFVRPSDTLIVTYRSVVPPPGSARNQAADPAGDRPCPKCGTSYTRLSVQCPNCGAIAM
ncbi:MAG TPA: hypothetical protein DEV93_17565 [Chloroflexi bacterium]|nr:hypothetical protein [Chloroflexota bacterium]